MKARIILYEITPGFYLVFNINTFNPQQLLQLLTGVDKLQGYASMGGTLSTSGSNFHNIAQNMVGNMRFLGKNIKWNGMNIVDIINAANDGNEPKKKAQIISKSLKSGQSFFDDVSADIGIDAGIASVDNGLLSNNRLGGNFAFNYSIPYNRINAINNYYFSFNDDIKSNRYIQIITNDKLPNYKSRVDLKDLQEYIRHKANANSNAANNNDESKLLRYKIYN